MLGKRSDRFDPDLDWIEAEVQKIPNIQESDVKIALDPQNCWNNGAKPILDQVECLICLNVVWKPRECQKCRRLCCQNCIDEWNRKQQSFNKCSVCRMSTFFCNRTPWLLVCCRLSSSNALRNTATNTTCMTTH